MKRKIYLSSMHHNNDDAVYVLESFLNITIPQGIKLSILPIFVPNTARGTTNVSFYLFPLVLVIFYYWIFVYLYYLPLDHSSLMVTYAYLLLFMYSKCYVHKLLNLHSTFSKDRDCTEQNFNVFHYLDLINRL